MRFFVYLLLNYLFSRRVKGVDGQALSAPMHCETFQGFCFDQKLIMVVLISPPSFYIICFPLNPPRTKFRTSLTCDGHTKCIKAIVTRETPFTQNVQINAVKIHQSLTTWPWLFFQCIRSHVAVFIGDSISVTHRFQSLIIIYIYINQQHTGRSRFAVSSVLSFFTRPCNNF